MTYQLTSTPHRPTPQDLRSSKDQLIDLISPFVQPLGYEVIYLEVQTHRQKTLRIYIDYLNPIQVEQESGTDAKPNSDSKVDPKLEKTIGIEDCVKVSRALEEPLDQLSEISSLFQGSSYELEVSSPGIDRPLRTSVDFDRFVGKQVRIHLFRPLTEDEIDNSTYQEKNPRQKNFVGILVGRKDEGIYLSVSPSKAPDKLTHSKKKKKSGASGDSASETANLAPNYKVTNSEEENRIRIPLPLISKANLEPSFEFEASDERE